MRGKEKMKKYKILTIEAREAYEIDRFGGDFHIYNKDGSIRFKRFNSFLHNSLELSHIQDAFENAKKSRRLKGKFVVGTQESGGESYDATLAVVNVVFNCNDKMFSRKKNKDGYVYIRKGEKIDFNSDICDHVCIRDGELVAIEVPYTSSKEKSTVSEEKYAPVKEPCDTSCFNGYFEYDAENRCYVKTNKKFQSLKTRNELRQEVYENGFTVHGANPVKYVRYKRSAGSSRQGNCLFIMEPLYKEMMKWSACGLDLDKVKDQISKESYISLTLSNMEKEIVIPKESILFLPDAKSIFESSVVAVGKTENGDVVAEPKTVTVENTIWDGQGLVDSSIFEENGYGHKGMMLLRNRFFKSCTFNTNLSAWFKDNGITSLDQLNPQAYTEARSIDEIKMIVTDSSLKYIKLCGKGRIESIKQWLQNVDSVFGVVKTEKPTKHFDGRMVQTSYQLINTLCLDEAEVKELLRPSIEYLWSVLLNPTIMRYHLNMQLREENLELEEYEDDMEDESDGNDGDGGSIEYSNMRKNVVMKLLSLSDDFARTRTYSKFIRDTKKTLVRQMRNGHLLVNGTNATLMGNGYEMLCAVIDKDYDFCAPVEKALKGNQIRCSRFEDGKSLLCARSPHITMGNLFVPTNSYSLDDGYSRYFNLTKEIVCVNSIGQNLLQRLNGCDFDSDSMLITDNEIMLGAAKRYYDRFPVPYCNESATPKILPLWEMDSDISNNKIGNIVNLSQWLNSICWDKLSKGEDVTELYYEICKLAVLSGIEIDKAKRDYGIDAQRVLIEVKSKCIPAGEKKPEFFKHITRSRSKLFEVKAAVKAESEDREERSQKNAYNESIATSMQFVNNYVNEAVGRRGKTAAKLTPLASILSRTDFVVEDKDRRRRNKIIEILNLKQKELNRIRGIMRSLYDDEKEMKMHECHDIEAECANFVKHQMKSDGVFKLLIDDIDVDDDEKERGVKDGMRASTVHSVLLASVCNANDNFYKYVYDGRPEMVELVEDDDGDIELYGYHFKEVAAKA